ncbi:hypothetical protein EPJ90_01320 [Erysipelothrix sp. strain 2 (EsS2-7-Brazil)]|uniref:hypothetical protein n=1 Tax=Erysipelothrix TaxID=1647 RepID=UPI00190D7D67|nr:hypothetical protein [Erysipelothrix sp. strain 2 (EsS2-7-Brazil)]MBK2403495.1 hypothetical protein [Erysipelothrix sp. strain 2 (EsS2-7-Brazil)]
MKGIVLAYGYTVVMMMLLALMVSYSVFKREYQQKRFQYRNALETLMTEMQPTDHLESKFLNLMKDQQGEVLDITYHFYPKLIQVMYKTKIAGWEVTFGELMIEEGF